MHRLILFALLLFAASAQPSPRRRDPPRRRFDDRRRYDPPRRRYDDRRRYDPPRRRYDPPRRRYDDRRRYVPSCQVPNCLRCDLAPMFCSKCKSGYTLDLPFKTSCNSCGANCARCDVAGGGKCDVNGCNSRYTYVKGLCKACSQHCQTCDRSGAGDCDSGKCDSAYGHWRNRTGCGACTPHCNICDMAGADNCNAGQCAARYTNDGIKCSPCASYCLYCKSSGPSRCDSCQDGYFVDPSKLCLSCATNCRKCNTASPLGCTDCVFGYHLDAKHGCLRNPIIGWGWAVGGGVLACLVGGGIGVYLCCRTSRPARSPLQQSLSTAASARSQRQPLNVTQAPAIPSPSAPLAPIDSVPSGSWRGYYTYQGCNHDVCEFHLRFQNGAVQGDGVDDVGSYSIRGKFDGRTHRISFTKQYRAGTRNQFGRVNEDNEGHAVTYDGRLVGQSLGAGFRGVWRIRNRGTNSDGVFHLWPAMETWASAPPLLEPTREVFQVAEDGECVVCMDQPISTCLRPCGHIALCSKCAARLRQSRPAACPICRSQIESVLTTNEVGPSAVQALHISH